MAAGDLDTSFDGNGKKTITFGGSDAAEVVLVQPNGRIVVAGGGGAGASSFCVVRLRSNGAPDTTFGPGGKRVIDFGADRESAFGAALQPDGSIVLVGSSNFRVAVARLNPNGSLDIVVAGFSDGDFALARLNADGSPDTTFGAGGKATVDLGAATFAHAVALQPNGRIVVAGQKTAGEDFAIARLRG